jgi:hypothetical protein
MSVKYSEIEPFLTPKGKAIFGTKGGIFKIPFGAIWKFIKPALKAGALATLQALLKKAFGQGRTITIIGAAAKPQGTTLYPAGAGGTLYPAGAGGTLYPAGTGGTSVRKKRKPIKKKIPYRPLRP